MNNIGEIIKKYRLENNLTQEQLGNKLFVTKQAISKWENNKSIPDLETINRICDVLGIDKTLFLDTSLTATQKYKKRNRIYFSVLSIALIISIIVCGYFISANDVVLTPENKILITKRYNKGINKADNNSINVTMLELITTPEKYHNKLIRVIGVGNLEFEGNAIYLSKDDLEYRTDNCIWIELGKKATPYEDAIKFNGKYVIVEGYYNKDNQGHFSMFKGTIEKVHRYELWEDIF